MRLKVIVVMNELTIVTSKTIQKHAWNILLPANQINRMILQLIIVVIGLLGLVIFGAGESQGTTVSSSKALKLRLHLLSVIKRLKNENIKTMGQPGKR